MGVSEIQRWTECRQEISRLKEQHAREISLLKLAHANEIFILKEQYTSEIAQLQMEISRVRNFSVPAESILSAA